MSQTIEQSSSPPPIEKKVSRVGVAQMCSINNKEENFKVCERLCQEAKSKDVSFLSFPECFAFVGTYPGESVEQSEPLSGPLMSRYRDLAAKYDLWLSLGGFHEKIEEGEDVGKIHNAHVIVNSNGEIVKVYRKIHLFDVSIVNGPQMQESKVVKAGTKIEVCETPIGNLGLSICYDLRFPELYTSLRLKGAQIILVPSAFTATTGKVHWLPLLQARAIENQCFVLAAAQYGWHHPKRESHGHSIIIGPWGEIINELKQGEGLITADLDLNEISVAHQKLPVSEHRRPHLYETKPNVK